ncbi:related to nitrate assimilation regulatory protein nirA [Fusarium fujikuroi]|nr:related to nitrate assimilation regulatory protein nirA [Fusarium fujikuroi]
MPSGGHVAPHDATENFLHEAVSNIIGWPSATIPAGYVEALWCDRGRPECFNCTEKGVQCQYRYGPEPAASPSQLERLARILKEPGELSNQLTTLPYHDALVLLNMLRETPRDPQPEPQPQPRAAISSSLSSSSPSPLSSPPQWSPTPPLPQYNIIGSLLPPVSAGMEFELMVRHPIAYPVLLPVTVSSLPLGELLAPRRSEAFGNSPLEDTKSVHPHELPGTSASKDATASTSSYEGLSHLTESHIHLLDQTEISSWTTLPIPNSIAVEAIALYLNNDYPVLPLFDADLFLRDLVHNQPYFCSRFLVAALLAWACQACTPMHPEAAHYSIAFFADARAQWSNYDDREAITLSNVSALQLLCMTAVTLGKDDLAFQYLRKGLQVAQAMGLVNLASGMEQADAWFSGHADWTRAASFVAWGTFNWVSNLIRVFSLHYHKSELEFPPRLFMPGDVEAVIAAEEGGQVLSPTSEIFNAACKLWTIFSVVTRAYYGQGDYIWLDQKNALHFAEDIYRQLLAWADGLPLSLVRCEGSSHAVFMLHIYYHAIITDIFRPFVNMIDHSRSMLRTFGTDRATPKVVYHASIRQMKRLLLSYRLEFSLEASSVLWQTCVIYVANATIRDVETNRDEMLFFLHLCLAGLKELFMSYRVFGSIAKGILGIAIREKALSHQELRRYLRRLKTIGERYKAKDDDNEMSGVMAKWVVDLNLALTDPERAQGGKLAEQTDRMSETCPSNVRHISIYWGCKKAIEQHITPEAISYIYLKAFIADTDTLSALTNMHPELEVGKPDFSPEAKLAWALIA